MSIELITICLFLFMLATLIAGAPIAFAIGGTAVLFGLLFWGPTSFYVILLKASDTMNSSVLLAVPLFVFMAFALEKSGVAERLYSATRVWLSGLPGGLAAATIIGCGIVAAMSGISTTGVLMMGIIGFPMMLRYGYDSKLAMGSIMAGGALGSLIPPSISFILWGLLADVSIGKLFMGGVIPGLMLVTAYVAYVLIRAAINPSLAPPVPLDERPSLSDKLHALRGVILPLLLVSTVLGVMFLGIATPTEAAAIGAIGALVTAAIHRQLNWVYLRETSERTLVVVAMVMWIIFSANIFSSIYQGIGAAQLVQDLMTGWDVNRWYVMILMQVIWILLGCFMDSGSILLITGPIFIPIAVALGFDPLWLGVLFVINSELGYLTPPFGVNLMVMRGIASPDIKTWTIYKSVPAFLLIQLSVLILCMVFPELATWLPDHVFAR
jgi:tripartite ATP-independent transporter DctM subunit